MAARDDGHTERLVRCGVSRSQTTTAAIVRAATRVFRARGYRNTSLADLAAATGLTKGAFYHHFRDKAAVMAAVLAEATAYAKTEVFARVADEGLGLDERLGAMVSGAERLFAGGPGGCLFANTALETSGVDDRFLPLVRAFVDAWRDALASLARDAGHAAPEAAAERVVADVEGAIVLMRLYGDRAYLDRALARVGPTLLP